MTRQLSLLYHVLIFVGLIQVTTIIVVGEPQVPCYFIFGDALVDSGNNNRLAKGVKANYPPYGIDFPQGVTGRFTNGRTSADIIGELLGFPKFIPPHATATNQEISTGVNYGSGGAGIRNETGRHLGDLISMDGQLRNHQRTISHLSKMQHNKTFTNEYLKKCIYLANIGSNDYINNYMRPLTSFYRTQIYPVHVYPKILLRKYSQQLRRLYNMRARKIVVFGLGQLGCTPAQLKWYIYSTQGKPCVEWINEGLKLFNDELKSLVDKLNAFYSDARFTFINLTSISAPLGDVPLPNSACCKVKKDGQCIPNSNPCLCRDLHLFYDDFHPSEISNMLIATRSYNAVSPADTHPYDISHLARL